MRLNVADYNKAIKALKNYKNNEQRDDKDNIIEYMAVKEALTSVSEEALYVFNELFINEKNKFQILMSDSSYFSERTFERKKRELIYAVHNRLNKNNYSKKTN